MKSATWSFSHVRLFATPWTVAHQAPLSMGFSRQGYWSGLPCPSPGNLPNPAIEPKSPAFQANSLPSEPPGNRTGAGVSFTERRYRGRLWFRLEKACVSFLDNIQVCGAIRGKEITAASSPGYCLKSWVLAAFPVTGEKHVEFHWNQLLLEKSFTLTRGPVLWPSGVAVTSFISDSDRGLLGKMERLVDVALKAQESGTRKGRWGPRCSLGTSPSCSNSRP